MFTPWKLTPAALASALLALGSAAVTYACLARKGYLNSLLLFFSGICFYLTFCGAVILLGLK